MMASIRQTVFPMRWKGFTHQCHIHRRRFRRSRFREWYNAISLDAPKRLYGAHPSRIVRRTSQYVECDKTGDRWQVFRTSSPCSPGPYLSGPKVRIRISESPKNSTTAKRVVRKKGQYVGYSKTGDQWQVFRTAKQETVDRSTYSGRRGKISILAAGQSQSQ